MNSHRRQAIERGAGGAPLSSDRSQARTVARVITPQPVIEGAGVRLKRSIATPTLDYVDPFLLFDHFGSDDPADYLAGFPVAPAPRHRDGDVHARRGGRPPRQHRQRRRHRRRGRPVDDRRRRHHARGDAAGARGRPHGRLPALGEPAGVAEDVAPPLPGPERRAGPGGTRATTARWSASSPARWTACAAR